MDEDGAAVVEKTYFVPDQRGISLLSTSGQGTIKKEAEKTWSDSISTTYYAQGYFRWGNGEVSVTNPTGGYSSPPSLQTFVGSTVDSGTGNYLEIFNKYAYVTYTLTTKSAVGMTQSMSVTIRIRQSGNAI
ncbi:MAG: hypothetical protein LBQ15_11475 [Clostridium sp.]|nr:hypothetical protein [Clostridium sp.]